MPFKDNLRHFYYNRCPLGNILDISDNQGMFGIRFGKFIIYCVNFHILYHFSVPVLVDPGGHLLRPFHGHPIRNVPVAEDEPSSGTVRNPWHLAVLSSDGPTAACRQRGMGISTVP